MSTKAIAGTDTIINEQRTFCKSPKHENFVGRVSLKGTGPAVGLENILATNAIISEQRKSPEHEFLKLTGPVVVGLKNILATNAIIAKQHKSPEHKVLAAVRVSLKLTGPLVGLKNILATNAIIAEKHKSPEHEFLVAARVSLKLTGPVVGLKNILATNAIIAEQRKSPEQEILKLTGPVVVGLKKKI